MAFIGLLFVNLFLLSFVVAVILLIVGLALHKKVLKIISIVMLVPQIIILATFGMQTAIVHHNDMKSLYYCLEKEKYKQAEKLLKNGGSVYFGCETSSNDISKGEPYFIGLCQTYLASFRYVNSDEKLQFLIDHGADVEYRIVNNNHEKDDPSHFKPADVSSYTVKQNIVDYGDSCGMTPLMVSAEGNNIKTFKVLIENGADVNAVSYCGRTVLMYACAKNYGDRTEIIKTLLEKGVDVNAEDNFGLTAMDFAKFSHNQEAVNLLKEYQEKNK